jgi:hypothetical protein
MLLTIPNVSEGRDGAAIAAIGAAFASTGARLLDVHADPDHHRTVYTLAGGVGEIWPALVAGASAGGASTCAARAAATRTSGRSTSRPSCTSMRRGAARPVPRR